MKLLVTGATGRMGKYIIPDLEKDYSLRLFGRTQPGTTHEFISGDIASLDDVCRAAKGCDAIIHLAAVAAHDDSRLHELFCANVAGTYNVFEAARRSGIKYVVNSSSICATGIINWAQRRTPPYFPVDEDIPMAADDMYGMSKKIGEELAFGYHTRYGVRSISLRVATVALPGAAYYQELFDNADNPDYTFKNLPIEIADFMWQYVDARDLAQAYRLSLEALVSGQVEYDIYNLGGDEVFSNIPSLELIKRYYPDTRFIDNENGFLERPHAPLWDISKIKRELGFKPRYSWKDYVTLV